ncbi:MAG: FliG C-terminal domain-containing protein [Candidatus Margulisbacteria bacterium]|nr:FliG C-terminal domain-containing protein [Candidatus Margulisiibacteriota bacterium]
MVDKTDIKNLAVTETASIDQVKKEHFSYINKENAYHTAHVLKKIIKSKVDNIKYLYLVISSVDPEVAERIMEEFDDEMKAQIIAEMLSLIQFTKSEIDQFDKILRKLLTEQFGGRYVLAKIIEYLDIDQKTVINDAVTSRYPETASAFRKIMLFFEDLFNVSEKDFARIFSDIPSDVLSIAFCQMPSDKVEKLYAVMPKGIKNMVQQGIEFGKSKYSRTEIKKAQQYIIEYSRNLERDGFIDSILGDDSGKEK